MTSWKKKKNMLTQILKVTYKKMHHIWTVNTMIHSAREWKERFKYSLDFSRERYRSRETKTKEKMEEKANEKGKMD